MYSLKEPWTERLISDNAHRRFLKKGFFIMWYEFDFYILSFH